MRGKAEKLEDRAIRRFRSREVDALLGDCPGAPIPGSMMVEYRSLLTTADSNPPDARNVAPFGVIEMSALRRLDLEPLETSLPGDLHSGSAGRRHLPDLVVPTGGGEPSRVNIDDQDRGSFTDGLAWTPDGREIVFSSNREGSFHLWRVPVGGGAPTRVEVFAQGLTHPAISRRGDRLAWTHTSLDTNIWRVEMGDAEGPKAPRVQLITSTMGDSSPQFSDDGRIVFTSSRSGRTEIWVADREGKSPVRLTHTAEYRHAALVA
jgi:WD40 repeat protein